MQINEAMVFNNNSFWKDIEMFKEVFKQYLENWKSISSFLIDDKDTTLYRDALDNEVNTIYMRDFLERDYEPFLIGDIGNAVDKILYELDPNKPKDDNLDKYFQEEVERIGELKRAVADLLNSVKKINILDLKDFTKTVIKGSCTLYRPSSCNDVRYENVKKIIKKIFTALPSAALKLTNWVIVPQSYIDTVAGEGTVAYFIDDNIFISDKEPEDNTDRVAPFHEFFHLVYSLISSSSHIYWESIVRSSLMNGTKQTRDGDRNSQLNDDHNYEGWAEEEFCDIGGILVSEIDVSDKDYIHLPSPKLISEFRYVLSKESFN